MVSHCANHSIQLKSLAQQFLEEKEAFPPISDGRAAFEAIGTSSDMHDVGWYSSHFSACPESYGKDRSFGFLFVADGLSTKMAKAQAALIFFCPATSHQGTDQHSHAMNGDEFKCIKSNMEMVLLLEQEITRAEGGMVPYSSNALRVMKEQHAKRLVYEQKRQKY